MVRHFKLLLLGMVVAAASLLTGSGKAHALSTFFPDASNDSTGHVYSIVTKAGGGVTLDAPTSDLQVFIRSSDIGPGNLVDIYFAKGCSNAGRDIGNSHISAQLYHRTSGGVGTAIPGVVANYGGSVSCYFGDMYFLHIPTVLFDIDTADYGSAYATLIVRVKKDSGSGIKAFKATSHAYNVFGVNLPSWTTFSELDNSQSTQGNIPTQSMSSVWNAVDDNCSGRRTGYCDGSHPPTENSIAFNFSPTCSFNDNGGTGGTAYLKWYDADYNVNNEVGHTIRYDLYDLTSGTLVQSAAGATLGGNAEFKQLPYGGFIKGHKYRWVWSNFDRINGIQFWMPFSEFGTQVTCGASTWQYTPNISAAAANPATYVIRGGTLTFNSWAKNNPVGAGAAYHLDLMRTVNGGAASSVHRYPATGTLAALAANATGPPQTGADTIPAGAHLGDSYCYFTRVTPASPSVASADSSQICYTVDSITKPFLDTAKGDVHAAGYDITCPAAGNGHGNILGQFSLAPLAGSKADYVVSAGGTISNFGSNGRPNGTALGYAHYGQVCMPRIVTAADAYVAVHGSTDPGANFTPGAPPAGTIYKHLGDLNLNGGTVGSRYTLYVVGDVHIKGDIGYQPGNFARGGLPSFGVIATGNIYIEPTAHNLVGFYYSQGTINTCSTGPGFNLSVSANVSACRNRLAVSGLLMADNIKFWRTFGDVSTPTPESEMISADGRLYLATPPAFSDVISPAVTNPNYVGDLPPLF